ncbi:hypothetical protein AB0M54_32305 [Actinoplanes sp. NPDC051470]|uniref:hypothetical protein n=1 Tax=unclassified Actinoplanes TaxID=2626549 RepID=UPI0034435BD6
MTTDSVPAGGDPRRLLADTRDLARKVRLDQRVTWVALLVLAGVTFLAIPFDVFGMKVDCVNNDPSGSCSFDRQGVLFFWPVALLIAYAIIALLYVRVARTRGVGARVMPYVITGAVLTVLFTVTWFVVRANLPDPPVSLDPTPGWVLFLDRLIAPWGVIGLALLVLAWLERNVALLVFTLAYLAVALVPVDFGWQMHSNIRTEFLPQQIINGTVLLLGGIGFAVARRRR